MSPLSRRGLIRSMTALAAVAPLTGRLNAVAQGDAIKVVTSFSILEDWVANVGSDVVTLSSIVPAGGDAHTFDPDPATVASIADADVIFSIGSGFDAWIADMINASGTDAIFLPLTDHLDLHDTAHDEHHEDHDDEHDHGDTDPHVWGDAHLVIHCVELIRDTLAEADPDRADQYREYAEGYISELEALDADIHERIETIPEGNRKLVTSHDTFGYYANAYGLEVIGTALGSVTTEGGDPSARDIAELVDDIRESGVPAIFAETIINTDLMQAIADEAEVELAPPLYSDALGEPGSDGDSYIAMMTYNTETIATALQ